MRQFMFTASILTGLILSACAEETRTDLEAAQSGEIESVAAEPMAQETLAAKTQTATQLKTPTHQKDKQALPKQYQNLDPKDISQAELDEFQALLNKAEKANQKHQKAFAVWQAQPADRRGPQPVWDVNILSDEETKRLSLIQVKVSTAQSRKKYEAYIPETLSQEEVDELLAFEQAQAKRQLELQEQYQAWSKQDSASRPSSPNLLETDFEVQNPRLKALRAKIQNANKIQQLTKRIDRVSAAHDISILDSELNELTALELEQQKFSNSFAKAFAEAQQKSQANGGKFSQADVLNTFPKHELQRMMDVQLRMQEIKSPLEAAEQATLVQNQLTALSRDSGIAILSSEIDETVALGLEKTRIENKAQREAAEKWLVGEGELTTGQPLPNDEDYARLKEIEARIKEISAPMNAAKNAAQEAQNPVLKTYRLERENREKWINVWRDKQQSGDVPRDAVLHSPSYAELQDRVKDYSVKLKTRAENVGYSIPEADISRLNSLNEEMLAIRKTVYDMEADGSAMIDNGFNGKTPVFKFTAGMSKVNWIETKQREILTGLLEIENSQNEISQAQNSEIGTRQFRRPTYERAHVGSQYGTEARRVGGAQYSQQNIGKAESLIGSFRARDIEISQADADDLLAFERELNNR